MPLQMPYGFYPSPNQMFFPPPMGLPGQQPPQAWLPQLPPFSSQPAPQANTAAAPPKPVKGPAIGDWLRFCDFHPHCEDDLDFLSLAKPFKTEGFKHLTSAKHDFFPREHTGTPEATVALALDRQRWYLHSSVQTMLTSAQRLTALYGYGRMLSSARHLRDVSLF